MLQHPFQLKRAQDSEFHLTAAKVQALLQCRVAENSSISSFFDTVLVTGYAWDGMEKCFWPAQVVARSTVVGPPPMFSFIFCRSAPNQ